MTYTTLGSVCGSCNHKHKSIATAYKCSMAHHRAIQKHNGSHSYSDRHVVRANGDSLDEDEFQELEQVIDSFIYGD